MELMRNRFKLKQAITLLLALVMTLSLTSMSAMATAQGDYDVLPEQSRLGYLLATGQSTRYCPELAAIAANLSNAAYDQAQIRNLLLEHGFSNLATRGYERLWNWESPGFAIGEKYTVGGRVVVIAVRGSVTPVDWVVRNANILLHNRNHRGFALSQQAVFNGLANFIGRENINSNTTFLITGHSLGGATANLLAQRLVDDGVNENSVFAYTFASPNVTVNFGARLTRYRSIFNVVNVFDCVTRLPAPTWGRYGRDVTFRACVATARNHGGSPPMPTHSATLYVNFLAQRNMPNASWDLGGFVANTNNFVVNSRVLTIRLTR